MSRISNNLFLTVVLSLLIAIVGGCTAAHYHKISLPKTGERNGDSEQHRINLGDILIHVQPRNEVKYNETTSVSIVPIDSKNFDKRLARKWPPLIVDFYIYTENDSYSFLPKEVTLSVNGQKAMNPSDVSGPIDRSEHISDWSLSIDKALGRIQCKTKMSKGVVSRGVDAEIKLIERGWLCYELHYNIAVPWPTDDIVITIDGMKKDGKKFLIPSMSYKEGEYTRLNF